MENREEFIVPPRPTKYPYDLWINGETHLLSCPDDFRRGEVLKVRNAIKARARQKNWRVVCKLVGSNSEAPQLLVWGDQRPT